MFDPMYAIKGETLYVKKVFLFWEIVHVFPKILSETHFMLNCFKITSAEGIRKICFEKHNS